MAAGDTTGGYAPDGTKGYGLSYVTAQNIFSVIVINEIQDFTILAPILNFIGKMAGKERVSGKFRRESRRIFNDKRQAAVWSVRHSA